MKTSAEPPTAGPRDVTCLFVCSRWRYTLERRMPTLSWSGRRRGRERAAGESEEEAGQCVAT